MNIETRRLLLREFSLSDAPRLTEMIAVPEIIRMLERPPWPYHLSDAKLWLRTLKGRRQSGESYAYAIDIPDEKLIGCISLEKKNSDVFGLGYWIGKDFWGQGYASEAAHALMKWAVEEMKITAITAGYFEDNLASAKLLSNLGFVATGSFCTINNPLRDKPVNCLAMRWNAP